MIRQLTIDGECYLIIRTSETDGEDFITGIRYLGEEEFNKVIQYLENEKSSPVPST